jgi:uncharacterized membrane protein YraQ (UPF0718 family)
LHEACVAPWRYNLPATAMPRSRLLTFTLIALAIVLGTIALDALMPVFRLPAIALPDALQNFVTVFLGIFIEAVPFLLLGSVASGLIAEFVSADDITRLFPRSKVGSTLTGSLMGVAFPVCECGVIPVVRRLYQKGLPVSAGIAFLLAAPVLNPVVIASTYAAFGLGPIFWGRMIFTLVIAFGVGLVFSVQPNLTRVVQPQSFAPAMGGVDGGERIDGGRSEPDLPPSGHATRPSLGSRLQNAFSIATDEFFDMGRFLVLGTLIATALQTFVPQTALVAVGRGPVGSVLALQVLAFVLSVCSTVDAFLALSFVSTFTAGAILAFLVFGPMFDIKSTIMYLSVFRPRVVVYMFLLTFLATLLMGVYVNLNLVW